MEVDIPTLPLDPPATVHILRSGGGPLSLGRPAASVSFPTHCEHGRGKCDYLGLHLNRRCSLTP